MQGLINDKENEVPAISLDFKKKPKTKPNSERTSSNSSLLKAPNPKLINSNTISLLQKKKQYSQSIRDKNIQKDGKTSRRQEALQEKISNQIQKFQAEALKISNLNSTNTKEYYSTKSQNDNSLKKSTKSFLYHPSSSKKDQKTKPRDVKKQKEKLQLTSMMIEGAKDHNFNQNFSIISISPNYAIDQTFMNQELSVIEQINDLSRIQKKNQLFSRQIDECFGPFETEQKKQTQMIKKQNNTFKKELAAFRKENTSLKREMEQLKKQLAVFQQRNQYLQSQSSEQLKTIQTIQAKTNHLADNLPAQIKNNDYKESFVKECPENDEKLREIIANYENQLFQTSNTNKKLQFKNYMLEKRILDQSELHKKQMTKEVSIWKQRYMKARNQNLRLKDSRHQMLFQMSISEQM